MRCWRREGKDAPSPFSHPLPSTIKSTTPKQVTEEDFLDVWLPLRSASAASHSSSSGGGKPHDGSGGAEGGEQGWRVRVQVLLSFLLMCAKETQQRASVEAALRAGRGRGESGVGGAGLSVSGSGSGTWGGEGGTGGPNEDLGYDDDGSGGEVEEEEVIRATTMMEGL